MQTELLHKMLPHDCERTLKIVMNEAEMISGRNLQDGAIDTIIKFLMEDIHTKFKWLTFSYLKEAIRIGLSSEYKYLDYKTICKWLYDFKYSPEMALKIALDSPLVNMDTPEWMPINWQMEVNKAFHRFKKNGGSTQYFHSALYSRMFTDGYIRMHQYHEYYKPEGENFDIVKINRAQRKVLADVFQRFKDEGVEYIYNPNQFFKGKKNDT